MGIDIGQGEFGLTQLRNRDNVGEKFAREADAAGTDDRDPEFRHAAGPFALPGLPAFRPRVNFAPFWSGFAASIFNETRPNREFLCFDG